MREIFKNNSLKVYQATLEDSETEVFKQYLAQRFLCYRRWGEKRGVDELDQYSFFILVTFDDKFVIGIRAIDGSRVVTPFEASLRKQGVHFVSDQKVVYELSRLAGTIFRRPKGESFANQLRRLWLAFQAIKALLTGIKLFGNEQGVTEVYAEFRAALIRPPITWLAKVKKISGAHTTVRRNDEFIFCSLGAKTVLERSAMSVAPEVSTALRKAA